MRVLYVCADRGIPLDGSKGASIHVRQTLGSLADAGVALSVLAARPGRWLDSRCRLIPAGPRVEPAADATPLEKEQACLAQTASLVRAAVEGAPEGGYDVVYERSSLWSTVGLAVAERMRIPLILEVNAPLVEEAQRYRDLRPTDLARMIEQTNVRGADQVLCVSSSLCRRMARLTDSPEKIELFPNVVDLRDFEDVGRDEAGDAPLIVFLGSLKPWHGVLDLLAAFDELAQRMSGPRLLFVGDGPLRSRLEQEIVRRGLGQRVELAGAVDHAAVPDILGRAQIGVAPYPQLDDFYFAPLKLVEYAAAGLAIVATEIGDYVRFFCDGEHLIQVPPGRQRALGVALERLCGNPVLRRELGVRAREATEAHLALAGASSRLLAMLHELGARGPGKERGELAG